MNDETYLNIQRTLRRSLSTLLSLKQQVLVKMSETLVNRYYEEFNSLSSIFVRTAPNGKQCLKFLGSQRRERWVKFKKKLSGDIEKLPIPKTCRSDIRNTIICLYRSSHEFEKCTQIFGTDVRKRYNSRGTVNLKATIEDYLESKLLHLSVEEKLGYLNKACGLCLDRCVQVILCSLLDEGTLSLESSLRNAGRTVGVYVYNLSAFSVTVHLTLKNVDPVLLDTFVGMLTSNSKSQLPRMSFSFEHNVMKVSAHCLHDRSDVLKLLWPKMGMAQKRSLAEVVYVVALERLDCHLFVDSLGYLNWPKRMELLRNHFCFIILCLLRHPFGTQFVHHLQLTKEDVEQVEKHFHFPFLMDIILEEGFNRSTRDSFFEYWRYISSIDDSLGDDACERIQEARSVLEQLKIVSELGWCKANIFFGIISIILWLQWLFNLSRTQFVRILNLIRYFINYVLVKLGII